MSFAADIARFAAKANTSLDEATRAVCVQLSSEIIQRTPVDTGRLRGAWVPGIGGPSQDEGSPDPTGSRAIADAARVAQEAPGNVFYLVNNLPYARRIEYDGWSKVKAPAGMVRVSVLAVQNAIRATI